jgi:hypothetical protein
MKSGKDTWIRTVIAVLVFWTSAAVAWGNQSKPAALVTAVEAYTKSSGDSDKPDFRHALFDLNGDKQEDAIVLLIGSYHCGSGGCTMLIFQGTPNGFETVSKSTVTREPIRVSNEKSQGWNALIVNTRGGDMLMRYAGKKYPLNPSTQPKATKAQVDAARILIK